MQGMWRNSSRTPCSPSERELICGVPKWLSSTFTIPSTFINLLSTSPFIGQVQPQPIIVSALIIPQPATFIDLHPRFPHAYPSAAQFGLCLSFSPSSSLSFLHFHRQNQRWLASQEKAHALGVFVHERRRSTIA